MSIPVWYPKGEMTRHPAKSLGEGYILHSEYLASLQYHPDCPACEVRKELLAQGGDHEGVMLLQTIARMSRQLEDLGAKYRNAIGGGFPVEVNGPAHAKMLIRGNRELGKPIPWEEVDRLMDETIAYIEALGKGQRPAWHEVAAKIKASK